MPSMSDHEVMVHLSSLKKWNYEDRHLIRTIQLPDFMSCVDFVNKIAAKAESLDHHPDLLLFDYNKVKVAVTTHSQGGVTEKDFKLAQFVDTLLS